MTFRITPHRVRRFAALAASLGCLLLTACDNSHKLSSSKRPRRTASHDTADTVSPTTGAGDIAVDLVSGNTAVGHRNFVNAKKILPRIYSGLEEDIYCGCPYSGKDVDLNACGYSPRKNAKRAARIEWEHVVPAEHLGSQRQCWQEGGRKACSGHDPVFDMMEGDLNNLTPSVGEVNGDRSNMSYGIWSRNPAHVYGQCASVPDFQTKVFQPREEVRGRLGRISLYMHTRYGLRMSKQDKQLWCAWARTSSVDTWEKKRDARIVAIQGEGNPLVSDPDAMAKICP
jgi:deoxyribonuclease-1